MKTGRTAGKIKNTTEGTGFGVISAVDHFSHPSLADGSRTHGTRLQGDIETAIEKMPVAPFGSPPAQNNHFRMGRGIPVLFAAVARGSNKVVLGIHEYGSHRDFPLSGGKVGLLQGDLHPVLVAFALVGHFWGG